MPDDMPDDPQKIIADLRRERDEALACESAIAEMLQVINSSPGDLAPVFETLLEKGLRLCGAAIGALGVWRGEVFEFVATRGTPALDFLAANPLSPPGSRAGYTRVARGKGYVQFADISASEFYEAGDPMVRAAVDLGGVRTTLTVPLAKDSEVRGLLIFHRQEVRPFSDQEIGLVRNFAAQAVIAMENARLLGELRERTEEVAGWNRELEARVAAQLAEIERTGKLRRFLAPQLADLIVAQGDESILESHRREIVVVFCDVRGFTGFAERAEPEEVMAFLRD
jgi:GAF domain-containing protein